MAKRIICGKCKKRRLPWFHFYSGCKKVQHIGISFMRVYVEVEPAACLCKGCVDAVFEKIFEALWEGK